MYTNCFTCYLSMQVFHGIYRVAEALIALQRVGNVLYLGWKMEVTCEPDNVEALAAQARIMEDELQDWENEVKEIRAEYCELNYFTTLQLVTLRRDLGDLKSDRANVSAVSPQVLSLLQSVSIDISPQTVVRAVREVAALSLQSRHKSISSRSAVVHSQSHDASLSSNQIKAEHQDAEGTKTSKTEKKAKYSSHKSKLMIKKLSDEKQEILMHVVDHFGFPQLLVLKAFEECKGEVNRYDIQNWCMENAEKYQFHDENSDDEATDIVDEEPPTSRPSANTIGMLSWVGQGLMQYFAPQKHSLHSEREPEVESSSLRERLDCMIL